MKLINDLYSKLQFSVVLLDSSRFHKFNSDHNWLLNSASTKLRGFISTALALCRGEQNCLVLSALCKHFYQLVRATHIKDNNFVRLFSSNLEMQTAIVDVVISQFSSNTTTENLIEVEEVFGVGDFVFFAGQFLWRLALLARAG